MCRLGYLDRMNGSEHWVTSWSPQRFDAFTAFRECSQIVWEISRHKFQIDDTVYLYTGAPESRITHRCVVVDIGLAFTPDERGAQYWVDAARNAALTPNPRMLLELVRTFAPGTLTYRALVQNGLKGPPQGPQRLNSKPDLLAFIEAH